MSGETSDPANLGGFGGGTPDPAPDALSSIREAASQPQGPAGAPDGPGSWVAFLDPAAMVTRWPSVPNMMIPPRLVPNMTIRARLPLTVWRRRALAVRSPATMATHSR